MTRSQEYYLKSITTISSTTLEIRPNVVLDKVFIFEILGPKAVDFDFKTFSDFFNFRVPKVVDFEELPTERSSAL